MSCCLSMSAERHDIDGQFVLPVDDMYESAALNHGMSCSLSTSAERDAVDGQFVHPVGDVAAAAAASDSAIAFVYKLYFHGWNPV